MLGLQLGVELAESDCVGHRPRLVLEFGDRVTPPQPFGLVDEVERGNGVSRVGQAPRRARQLLERGRVELVGVEPEPIAGADRLDPIAAAIERRAQPVHIGPHVVLGPLGRFVVGPDHVDEVRNRHHLVSSQGESGQHPSLSGAAERQWIAIGRFDLPEQTNVHHTPQTFMPTLDADSFAIGSQR